MRIGSSRGLIALAVIALGIATAPASALDGYAVRVPLDVAVYNQPGGVGQARPQHLKGGSRVILINENEHWCQVDSWKDPVPGGKGWIWCGQGDDGQDYSVTKLSADEISAPEPSQGGDDDKPQQTGNKCQGEVTCPTGYVVLDKPNKYGACCEPKEGFPTPVETEKCKFGMEGTPPSDCHCPKNTEFMGPAKGCVPVEMCEICYFCTYVQSVQKWKCLPPLLKKGQCDFNVANHKEPPAAQCQCDPMPCSCDGKEYCEY